MGEREEYDVDNEVVRSCARILDDVATYLYLNQYKSTETVENIKRIVQAQPNFWDVVMRSLLNAFIFGSSARFGTFPVPSSRCIW